MNDCVMSGGNAVDEKWRGEREERDGREGRVKSCYIKKTWILGCFFAIRNDSLLAW